MPLTEEQVAALGLLAAADPEEVAAEVKSKANPLWTSIFNAGHKKATSTTSKDVQKAEEARDAALERVRTLEADLEKARKGNPDVEQVRAEAQKALADAKKEAEDKERALTAAVEELRKDMILSEFERLGTSDEFNIRGSWMKNILRDPELRDRIALGKEKGEFDILQPGKKIPIQAEDETPTGKVRALVKERVEWLKANDPDGIRVNTDDGGGQRGGGGEDGTGSKAYDPVKDGQARAAAQKGPDPDKSLALR